MKRSVAATFLLLFCKFIVLAQGANDSITAVLMQVVASESQMAIIPQSMKEKAVVDGKITYLVAYSKNMISNLGVEPKYIIGLVIDPSKGISEGNILPNGEFLSFIKELAMKVELEGVMEKLKEDKYHMVLLFDQRTKDINLPIRQNIKNLIGIYYLDGNSIAFEANKEFSYFENGVFMELTPELRELVINN